MFRNRGLLWQAPVVVRSTLSANANMVDTTFFIADSNMELVEAVVRFITKGSDAGGLTLDVKKVADGSALATGVSMLATTFNVGTTGTNDTLVRKNNTLGTLSATAANRRLIRGNAVLLDFTGTITALAGLLVQLTFLRTSRPAY